MGYNSRKASVAAVWGFIYFIGVIAAPGDLKIVVFILTCIGMFYTLGKLKCPSCGEHCVGGVILGQRILLTEENRCPKCDSSILNDTEDSAT